MNEQVEWIFYRLTEPIHCCANCRQLRDKTCEKGNRSLKDLKLCAERDTCEIFRYGSTCDTWR